MRQVTRRGLAGTIALVAALALTNCAHANLDLIFDNFVEDAGPGQQNASPRDGGLGLGCRIQIDGNENITVNQIGILNSLKGYRCEDDVTIMVIKRK